MVQVPFIGWTGEVPMAGRSVQRLLQAAAKPFVSTFMRRTGRQFFMQDGQHGRQPLLVSPNCYLNCLKAHNGHCLKMAAIYHV